MNIYEFLGYLRENPGKDVKVRIMTGRRRDIIDLTYQYIFDIDRFLVRDVASKIARVIDRATIKENHSIDSFNIIEEVVEAPEVASHVLPTIANLFKRV